MKHCIAWLASAALALALVGCREEAAETAAKLTPVTVEPVEAVVVEERIEATGQLVAVERAEIAAEVDGQVTELAVEEGSAVAEGDVVLTIDPERRALEGDSARALLDEASAAVREQEREYARVKELRGRKVASETKLDQTETALALARSRQLAAQARLGMAERALRDATVRAPFKGLIAQRFVSRGEYVSAGRKLFELVALDPIEVEFRVTEADSSRVALHQAVAVRVASHPDEVFTGKVHVVSPVIDERSRTLRVKARIENSEGRLRPGLFARIDLGINTREGVVMIPEDAILQRADGAVVFRASGDGRVERVVIETGVHRDGRAEVVRGIAAGDRIVTRGQFRLADGQAVSLRTPAGEAVDVKAPDVAGRPD